MQADMRAELGLHHAGTRTARARRCATRSDSASTMWVCGEMGYAATTCGRQRATVSATAREPSICLSTATLPGGDDQRVRLLGEAQRWRRPPCRRARRTARAIAPRTAARPTTPVSRGERAEQRGVGQWPPEALAGEVGRRDGERTLAAARAGDRPSASSATRAVGVDEDETVLGQAREARGPRSSVGSWTTTASGRVDRVVRPDAAGRRSGSTRPPGRRCARTRSWGTPARAGPGRRRPPRASRRP